MWEAITCNKVFNAAMVSWFVAQASKVILLLITSKRFKVRKFLQTGGMPSSHSSMVMTLCICVARLYDFTSPLFGVCLVFAIITMHDAAGVRRAAGKQARVLNRMIEEWDNADPEFLEKRLIEFLGHTPIEVVAGGILGVYIGLVMPL